MRHLRFWMTGEYQSEKMTGLRGQMGVTGQDDVQLYDIIQEDGMWHALKWFYVETDPDARPKKLIFSADNCFDCMVAAEQDAIKIWERMQETEDDY